MMPQLDVIVARLADVVYLFVEGRHVVNRDSQASNAAIGLIVTQPRWIMLTDTVASESNLLILTRLVKQELISL